jgi:hypothetical protein
MSFRRRCTAFVFMSSLISTLHAQSPLPRATAERAITFAVYQHSARVLGEKMPAVCAKPRLQAYERRWCTRWNGALRAQLAGVERVEATPPMDTLLGWLAPFSATRAEAIRLRNDLRWRLGRGDSLAAARVLYVLERYLPPSDAAALDPIRTFLRTSVPAPVPAAPAVAPPPFRTPEPVLLPDAVIPEPDTSRWKVALVLTFLVGALGWWTAWRQRRYARLQRQKAERLYRELHAYQSRRWFETAPEAGAARRP